MKKYFYRVWICFRHDFSKGVFCVRAMADLRDLADSLAAVLAGFIGGLISIIRLLIRPFWTLITCFTVRIKHGAGVEEKLKI